jgi:alpha-tubulin suppressor-like RCC1 family protein
MVYFLSIALSFITFQALTYVGGAVSLDPYDLSESKASCSDCKVNHNADDRNNHNADDRKNEISIEINVTTKQLQQIGLIGLLTNANATSNATSFDRNTASANEHHVASSDSEVTPEKADPSSARLPSSLGLSHTCAVDKSKNLNCWGFNSFGQVGNDSTRNVRTPTLVIQATAASHVTQVVLGYQHTCAIDNLNDLYCWGENTDGQIGDNSNTNSLAPTHIAPSSSFTFVAVGSRHTCALDTQQDLYCWGDNTFGQLGNGSSASRLTPTLIAHPARNPSSKFVKLALGDFHTCAIDDADDLYCWGYNFRGQLGDNSNTYFSRTPTLIVPPTTTQTTVTSSFVQIALGRWHTCAVDSAHDLYCWGGNDEGELGNNSNKDRTLPTLITHPNSNTASSFFVEVSLGAYYTCALDNTSDLYCWGANDRGQVGDIGSTQRLVPTLIPHPAKTLSTKFVKVTLGEYHTCALDNSNNIYCWGNNDYSQLGDGSNVQYSSPTHMTGF